MLTTSGKAGITMNPDKFQFAQRTMDFAGFRITDTSIEPLSGMEPFRPFLSPRVQFQWSPELDILLSDNPRSRSSKP